MLDLLVVVVVVEDFVVIELVVEPVAFGDEVVNGDLLYDMISLVQYMTRIDLAPPKDIEPWILEHDSLEEQ